VGLLLIVVPWSGFWERNYFLYAFPALRPALTNAFVRGAVSGLGVVNLFTGLMEIVPIFLVRSTRYDVTFADEADTQVRS
jgi:hypothetical protein